MGTPQDQMYAIAVREDPHLRLLCRIRRSRSGDVYFLIPRQDPVLECHASYHRDGTRHVKSCGGKCFISHLRKPDEFFRGTEALFALAIQPGEVPLHTIPCEPEKYSELFEIGSEQLPPEHHYTLAVDLVEPGCSMIPVLGKQIVAQMSFRDASPWILVTIWKGTLFGPE